jgi:hydroxymethylglutaryl-CoA lyase
MSFPERVSIVEVGPRDGLQNEPILVSVDDKVAFIELLVDSGLTRIEAGSFVSPKAAPQMASTGEVFKRVSLSADIRYSALTPNLRGFEAALAAGVKEIAIFASASETFSQNNINCSIAGSIERFAPIVREATARGVVVRGYVSCVLGCPYEGDVEMDRVAAVARNLYEMGCYEISLGDTTGVGTPLRAQKLIETIAHSIPIDRLAVHFHDTYGQALANIFACLEVGVSTVDSSVAGLGGCPYARGATGNVATEDVVYMLDGMKIETGVDLFALLAAGSFISHRLGRAPASRVACAFAAKKEG